MQPEFTSMQNFAGTTEHQKYIEQFQYIFTEPYFVKTTTEQLDKYSLAIDEYNHTYDVSEKCGMSISCQEYHLYNERNQRLFNVKFCFGRSFYGFISHTNGNEYFICGNDLCDLAIFNITEKTEYRFISGNVLFENYAPGCSNDFWYINGFLYDPESNLLAVNGHDTMNRATCVLADFSFPEVLPYTCKRMAMFCDDNCTATRFTATGLLMGIGEENYFEEEISYKTLRGLLDT